LYYAPFSNEYESDTIASKMGAEDQTGACKSIAHEEAQKAISVCLGLMMVVYGVLVLTGSMNVPPPPPYMRDAQDLVHVYVADRSTRFSVIHFQAGKLLRCRLDSSVTVGGGNNWVFDKGKCMEYDLAWPLNATTLFLTDGLFEASLPSHCPVLVLAGFHKTRWPERRCLSTEEATELQVSNNGKTVQIAKPGRDTCGCCRGPRGFPGPVAV
jgi:hypothetical protein